MQKWMKCNVPPMRQADVFGAGNGTLFGKMDISKAIQDGKAVTLAPSKSARQSRREYIYIYKGCG